MEQNIYTIISKSLGFQGSSSIPSTERAQELLDLVEDHNRKAFEEVFRIHRFAKSPNPDQEEAMKLIYQAFLSGSEYFKNQFPVDEGIKSFREWLVS